MPADIAANNIVAISMTPGTENQTYHVVRDDYANMMDIISLSFYQGNRTAIRNIQRHRFRS